MELVWMWHLVEPVSVSLLVELAWTWWMVELASAPLSVELVWALRLELLLRV
jgi:hypothetical protein